MGCSRYVDATLPYQVKPGKMDALKRRKSQMHPKTFNIRLHRPFGLLTQHPYVFHLHAASAREALDWVARVFDGIDIHPTLQRWANPSTIPRVGNTDPVSVIDCDAFRIRAREGGKSELRETPQGHFRRSEQDITDELLKVFNHLHSEHLRLVQSFQHMKRAYERDGVAWYFERVAEIKAAAENALRWKAAMWWEYLSRARSDILVMPARAALAA